MRQRHNTIKFTHEVEDHQTLCFLDTQIKRLTTASNTNQQLSAPWFIDMSPLNPDDDTTELNKIKTTIKINGYSEEIVDRIHNKHKKKEELWNLTTLIPVLKRDAAPTKIHAITFYPGITKKLQSIFRNHQIDLVYSNKGKLKDSLGNPKDITEMLQKSGIYQVEHYSSIRLNHLDKSNIARQVLSKINDNQGHSISLNNLKLVKEVRKQNELDAY
jgi:spore coat protein CotF